jgi:hypothetical protein
MIFRFLLFFTSLFFSLSTLAQSSRSPLKNQLTSADSIVIVSHVDISRLPIVEPDGSMSKEMELIIDGGVNQEAITQSKTLSSTEIATLRSLLLLNKPPKGDQEICFCFISRHSIFIYSKGLNSYVDLCFGCSTYQVYGRLTNADLVMYKAKWKALQAFFEKSGF